MEAILDITLRTLLVYVFIVIIFRVMGKREIGELGILDLVVFVMIAEMAVMSIEQHIKTYIQGIYPMFLLAAIQLLFAYVSLKSRRFRKLVDGEPTIIIKDGRIQEKQMRKQRYNFDDLLMQLREKDIRDIADVEFAILEPTGKLSVLKKENNKRNGYSVPLILDGEIQEDKLEAINKSESWVRKELAKQGYKDLSEVSFCSYNNGTFYIDKKEESLTSESKK